MPKITQLVLHCSYPGCTAPGVLEISSAFGAKYCADHALDIADAALVDDGDLVSVSPLAFLPQVEAEQATIRYLQLWFKRYRHAP
jgi:hypothetical protein